MRTEIHSDLLVSTRCAEELKRNVGNSHGSLNPNVVLHRSVKLRKRCSPGCFHKYIQS
jgi:hypothetical protein